MNMNQQIAANNKNEALRALQEYGNYNYSNGYKRGLLHGFVVTLIGTAILGIDWKLVKERIKSTYEQEFR